METKCSNCNGTKKIQASCEVCKYKNVDCCDKYSAWCYDIPCPVCLSVEYKRIVKRETVDPVKAIFKKLGGLGVKKDSVEGRIARQIINRG